MDQSDTDIPQTPTVPEENSRTTRRVRLPSCFSSRPASVVSIFCFGLISGAAGGLLLGRTAVVVLRSLELLADNKLLMDHLENYIKESKDFDLFFAKTLSISQRTNNDYMYNIAISVLAEEFGVFSSTLSLAVGLFIGLSVYELIIKTYDETAMVKALTVAGPVCLMGVTATGYILGLALQGFLSITYNVVMWLFISEFLTVWVLMCFQSCLQCCNNVHVITLWLLPPLNTPVVLGIILIITIFLKTKLILMVALIPTILVANILKSNSFQLIIAPMPLMLLITDVFNFARQPIVTFDSPTNTSSAVLEGVFVGVLTSQLLMVAVGMSLFVFWQRGGAGKICVSAAGSGVAVVAVIESVLPVLGPGPTIGALMGVAGAVGVSLSAAGAVTDRYGQVIGRYGLVGRLGVTVGAAVGAFLYSCTHSGLSGIFMGLCAASVPAGVYLKPMFLFLHKHDTKWKFNLLLRVLITILFLIWLPFTCTNLSAVNFESFLVSLLECIFVFYFMLGLCLTWGHASGGQDTNSK